MNIRDNEIVESWLTSEEADYEGLGEHLRTIATQAQGIADQIGDGADSLGADLSDAQKRTDGAFQKAYDAMTAYAIAARQISIEAEIRATTFMAMQPLSDDRAGRRKAAGYAILLGNALAELLKFQRRAADLSIAYGSKSPDDAERGGRPATGKSRTPK
ncbi:hypothetical protein [Burkholderia gladioli]|uniref:hypothetical protein n=1 Tax=Burkholderia gladioli TaxID=28095 RepID=UPI00163FEC97|nr:hypothetical protein [Burkholderia gladioli]